MRGALSFYGVLEMTGDETQWRGLGRGIRILLERRVVQFPYLGNEEVYRALSPYERIGPDAPPFFVVQGVNDTLVDVNVARSFVAKFRAVAFAPIYYVELPFTQHAFDLTASPRTSATTRAAVAFAESVVSPRPTPSAQLLVRTTGAADATSRRGPTWRVARRSRRARPRWTVLRSHVGQPVLTDPRRPDQNEVRRGQLRRFLQHRGIDFFETVAEDPHGSLAGRARRGDDRISRLADARAFARAWDQYAFYEVSNEGVTVRDADSNDAYV